MTLDMTTNRDTTHEGVQVRADVREAALRSLGRPGRGYWILIAALSAVVVLGLVAWIIQLRRGLGSAGYNDEAFWGIYIADVVTFVGVSYGGAVVSAILRLTGADWRAPLTRLAEGTAVVTVIVGGGFIIPHLGRPERIWELVTRPNLSSPIFWDFIAVCTYAVGSIVFFALPLVPDTAIALITDRMRVGRRARLYNALSRGWVGSPRQRRVLHGALGVVSIMIIPLAVSVHSVLAWAFALVSRPWWHESIWAPYFVVAALYSGVALVILVVAGFRRGYHLEAFIHERHFVRLGYILAVFSMTYLYLTFADILPGAYVGEPGTSAVFHELLVGHFALWFWLFVVCGGIVPLLLIALPWTRTVPGLVVAAAFVAPSMWLKRMLMVVDPSTYDRVAGTFGTFHFSWIAISMTLAGVAAVALLIMLLFRIFPLLSIDEMEEITGATQPAPRVELDVPATSHPRRPTVRVGAVILILLGGGVLGVASARPAQADTVTSPPALSVSAKLTGDTVELAATVVSSDGSPGGNMSVSFYVVTTEFGPQGQDVPIGTVVTDASGAAHLSYRPTLSGADTFVARVNPAGSKVVTAKTTVHVTQAVSAYTPAPTKPFSTVGKNVVLALLLIVAAIWIALAAQVGRVRRACRRASPSAPSTPAA